MVSKAAWVGAVYESLGDRMAKQRMYGLESLDVSPPIKSVFSSFFFFKVFLIGSAITSKTGGNDTHIIGQHINQRNIRLSGLKSPILSCGASTWNS